MSIPPRDSPTAFSILPPSSRLLRVGAWCAPLFALACLCVGSAFYRSRRGRLPILEPAASAVCRRARRLPVLADGPRSVQRGARWAARVSVTCPRRDAFVRWRQRLLLVRSGQEPQALGLTLPSHL